MFNQIIAQILIISCMATSLSAATIVSPKVVPAVAKWSEQDGTLKLKNPTVTISVATLKELGELLVAELAGSTYSGVSSKPSRGGIFLKKGKLTGATSPEAYQIQITQEHVTITAPHGSGLFYGTRTLLQLLKQSSHLSCGVIEDAPRYPVRSVLVDVGRKFMPVEDLKDWIRIMGWMKINELHFHLNDSAGGRYPGYRLESKKFPGLASKDGYYTFKQIRELQDFAKLRGVVIVPEIDTPGHSLAFTTYRPDLANTDLNHPSSGLGYLDINNPEAYRFMEAVWDEVCPLFDSPVVHIGTDEYRLNLISSAKKREQLGEKFRQYINHFNTYITKKHGKTVRTWSGYEHMPGTTVPDTSIIIDMWETSDAKNKVNAGYRVVNSSHLYTYIVPGAPYYGVNNRFIYEKWTPMQFSGKPAGMLSPEDPGLMGAKLHVWNDRGPSGYTWNEITRLTIPSMATMGEKMWGGEGAENYDSFLQYATEITSNIPKVRLTQRKAATKSNLVWALKKPMVVIPNSATELSLPAENLEWPWTLNLSLTRHNDVKGDEILLSSKLATLYLDLTHVKHDKKKKMDVTRRGVAIVRANQAYGRDPITSNSPDVLVFNYQIPLHQKVTLTLVGERRRTSLYVDGKLVDSIGKQMVCPLSRIGDTLPRGPHATYHQMNIKSSAPASVKIGAWSSGKVSIKPAIVDLDITQTLKREGEYKVVFQYTSGGHRLDIDKVELLQSGKVIHTDKHPGNTGGKNNHNIYSLPLKSFQKGARYSIRATIHSDGGTDSNGTILLQEAPTFTR